MTEKVKDYKRSEDMTTNKIRYFDIHAKIYIRAHNNVEETVK